MMSIANVNFRSETSPYVLTRENVALISLSSVYIFFTIESWQCSSNALSSELFPGSIGTGIR